MRIFVVIPHYFYPEPEARHSSVDENRRDERKAMVEKVLLTWRHSFGAPHAMLNIERKKFDRVNLGLNDVTLVVLTTQGRHLLDDDFCKRNRINLVECKVDDPRMLGHDYVRYFAEHLHTFDYFVFSEDDLLVTDPQFIDKVRWFEERFGFRRLLMPNRFEWNANGPAMKTFIDGDVAPRAWERWTGKFPDEDFITASALADTWSFRRARNPHSGMHIVSRAQLDHWMRQPHWGDRDAAFIGPLESAATLGVMKTFSIYKSWGRSLSVFAVEHLDHRFSSIPLDYPKP